MIPQEKLNQLITRHEELEHLMSGGSDLGSDDFVKISREYSDLTPVVKTAREFMELLQEISDLEEMLEDSDTDAEMRELAELELPELKEKLPELEHQVQLLLLPKDIDDDKNALLEIRAGTGGDEAALFAGDLFRMYQRYAQVQGLAVRSGQRLRKRPGRFQGSRGQCQRQGCVCQTEI